MHFIYIDDSGEDKHRIFSAIAVPVSSWNNVFLKIKTWRQNIRASDGILIYKELHATEFVAGRGRLGPNVVTKHRRSQIFMSAFLQLASTPEIRVFNVCFQNGNQEEAFEWLLNRINRTMQAWDSYAHLVCDEGKEAIYTKMVRRMRVYNPIPSRLGLWMDTGDSHRNITLERIIEDPQFKKSSSSYFIQMADFVAYGLLRREKPNPKKNTYGIHKCFDVLEPICVKAASRYDALGIIRK